LGIIVSALAILFYVIVVALGLTAAGLGTYPISVCLKIACGRSFAPARLFVFAFIRRTNRKLKKQHY
jgi:hypothetical protein